MKDKLLFIPFMIFKKCDIPFTIGIRAGRSVRPSRWVV